MIINRNSCDFLEVLVILVITSKRQIEADGVGVGIEDNG
jgi:hypothetical protein